MKATKLWLITIAALLCSLAASAHDFEVDGIYYNITSSAGLMVEVTYQGSSPYSGSEYTGAVTIPETVTYSNRTYCVTSIGEFAFAGCVNVTSITIPSNVVTIELRAFDGCSSLTTFTIPANVTSIKSGAFICENLSTLIIEDGTLPLSLGSFGYTYDGKGMGIFYRCPLKTVYLGRNLIYESSNSKGYSPFYENNISDISIGDSVTSIGDCLFGNNYNLVSVNIPRNITSIGRSAFSGCNNLTSVTIPNSITSIKDNTFSGCSSLTSIVIPNSITSIESNAFKGCRNLVTITIPESVTSIGSDAFYNCSSLAAVHVSNIAAWCNIEFSNYVSNPLYYAKNLYLKGELVAELTIPEDVTSIGSNAFSGCSSLTSITIPESVTSIGDKAFYNCSSLYSVTIGSGVLSIGNGAFSTPEKVIWLTNTPPTGYANAQGSINYVANDLYTRVSNVKVYPYLSSMFEVDGVKYVPVSPSERTCHAIDCAYDSTAESINVSETASFKGIAMTVKEVMPYTFYGNKHIKEVNISHKGNIGDYAFYDCDSVQSVEISNEGNVESQAFYDCDGILTATISNQGNIESQAFYDCDGIKSLDISNVGYVGDEAFRGCGALETAIVANTGAVNSSAFYDCVSLKSATLGDKVTSLGNDAFRGCISLQEIVIPNSVKWVGTYCFYGCTVMKSAVIGDGLTNVKEYTFANCGLEKIIIGDNITSIGNYAFKGCSGMKSAVLGDGLTEVNGTMFDGCIGLEKVEIGNRITELEANAFSGCSSLSTITIPQNVTSIGDYAFKGCTGMKSAVLGDGLTKVNGTMFDGCIGLEKVEIGNNVRELVANAFSGCSSLSTITIPRSVTTIGDNAFAGCSRLSDVIISDRTTALALGSNGPSALFADCPLDSVYIGGKITYNTTSSKGYSPFYRNTSLRTVVITDREEQIYANEFYGCTALTDVTIGNGVKSIGNYAFSGCSSLEGFSFGSNMESIGAEAFSDCTRLTNITSHAAVPPTCGTQALDDINKWSCTLRVPSGYDSAYQGADQWKEFFFVEDVVEVAKYTLTFMVDGEVYHTSSLVHKAEVTIPDAPTKEGYTFSGWNKVPATMPAEDVVFNGFFTINKYLVTFKIGDEVISSKSLEYGANIVAPEAPEREGYTFDGWGEVAEIVSAGDVIYEGSYSVNSYLLTYMVDGETIQVDSIAYGTEITLLDELVKEGYTFSGWNEVPATMPAKDVTITGFFTINKYLVTFVIDGEVIASDSIEYNAEIIVPEAPVKEGYTFSGWGEVPAIMPAEDVTISGSFTPNIYKVYYYVDEELVHTAEVACDEVIPEYVYEPTVKGEVFVGWIGEAYETMPAHNLTYKAEIEIRFITLTIDQYGSGTFCSIHDLDFSEVEGLKAYVATGYNTATGVVTLTRVMSAKSGEGLFLKGQPGDYEVPTLKSSESCMQNLLVGALDNTIVNSTSEDGLNANYEYKAKGNDTTPVFYSIVDGSVQNAGKAYLQLPKAWLGTGATRAIGLCFDDEEMVSGDEEQPAIPAVIYDLQGRRVMTPTKGTFIVNGKKVVFK